MTFIHLIVYRGNGAQVVFPEIHELQESRHRDSVKPCPPQMTSVPSDRTDRLCCTLKGISGMEQDAVKEGNISTLALLFSSRPPTTSCPDADNQNFNKLSLTWSYICLKGKELKDEVIEGVFKWSVSILVPKGKINCSGSNNILSISLQMKALNNQKLNHLSMAPLMEL